MDICFGKKVKLDRSAWLRLLGVSEEHLQASETDGKMRAALERLTEQMDEAEGLLLETALPCFAYRAVGRGALDVRGESLEKHLEGCRQLVLMAVTLGDAVDDLISETQRTKIALGVVLDSGASVMAELAADLAQEQIRREVSEGADGAPAETAGVRPLFMTARFSPGYGDSPLEMQAQVLDLLDAEDRLGITLSQGFMMSPSKSITGILGLADHPVTGRLATCAECVLHDKCRLIKEGKRCYASPEV